MLRLGIAVLFHGLQFVEQGFVADFEDLSSLAAVPACLCQNTLNGFALGLHGSTAADLQQ